MVRESRGERKTGKRIFFPHLLLLHLQIIVFSAVHLFEWNVGNCWNRIDSLSRELMKALIEPLFICEIE